MWAVQIVGSLNKVLCQFLTDCGNALHVLNYRQVFGLWKAVTWSGETIADGDATAIIAAPVGGGSIEITDMFFSALKATGSTVTLYFSDGTNTETWITVLLTNEAVRLTHAIQGRMQGWRDAKLKFTVADANSSGSIMVGYVKHGESSSEDYSVWNSRR